MGSTESGDTAGGSPRIHDLRAAPEDAAGDSQRIKHLRRDFGRDSLVEELAGDDPFVLFGRWFDDALSAQLRDANAFVLSTADTDGRPSSRVLLLKDYSPAGFVFYTNYASRKGDDLARNPRGAILFYWAEHERQVRIEGAVAKVSREESAEYFASRPRESQLGAHASHQSSQIKDRAELEDRFAALEGEYGGEGAVPLPEDWGGYILKPDAIEFWQGRSNRLHDRLLYSRAEGDAATAWSRARLSP